MTLEQCIPCHALPTATVQTSWRSAASHLHNFRKPPEANCCQCKDLQVPDECRSPSGHVVLWGNHLADFLKVDAAVTLCSTKEAIYPDEKGWKHAVSKAFTVFLADNHIAWGNRKLVYAKIQDWATEQWRQHINNNVPNKYGAIAKMKPHTKTMVFHCEDHRPTRLVVFCPKLYRQLISATFSDEKIWRTEHVTASKAARYLWDLLPKGNI